MTMQTDPVWSPRNIGSGPRSTDVDRHVGSRLRERRIMLGMTQQQMAEAIGVTYQQAHKYEKGINRMAAGRLYHVAQKLGTDVNYFFEGLDEDKRIAPHLPQQQRMLLEISRSVQMLPFKLQQVVASVARALRDGMKE